MSVLARSALMASWIHSRTFGADNIALETSFSEELVGAFSGPNRRRSSRRRASVTVEGDSRRADRRRQKPGLAGLLRDMCLDGGGSNEI
jgi:hypothetical protein